MIEKFGFFLQSLGPNQAAYQLIKSANKLLETTDKFDVCMFYHDLTPLVVQPSFAVCNMFELYAYKGRIVSLDLNSASRSLDYLTNAGRFFFVNDLEWTKLANKQYEQLANIYCNKKLPIIARSNEHAKILELTWNSNVIGVVPDFNVQKTIECILKYESGQ